MKTSVTVQAHANIALIKYWGKRDENLFLPTKRSLSITLAPLTTVTTISLCSKAHTIFFNGILKPKSQITTFLDRLKTWLKLDDYFCINTGNTFPTAAGLASSASGYAALVFGLNELYQLGLSTQQLSLYARQGSGSACRSVFGGFALWNKGILADGSDSVSQQLFDQHHWAELRVLVAIVSHEEKNISSRQGMMRAITTSPSYWQWVEESEQKIPLMIQAIHEKDFETVGWLAEHDCLGMHHTMHTSKPSFTLWTNETNKLMSCVYGLRNKGIACFFTIDAGPNVKILCLAHDVPCIKKELATLGCVKELIECAPGGGPRFVD